MTTSVDQRDDADLVAAVVRGELDALGELYHRHAAMVSSVLRRHVPELSDSDVEDVCHEVFLTVLDAARRYQDRGRVRPWLCGIALHKARQLRRNRWLRSSLLGWFGKAVEPAAPGLTGSAIEARLDLERVLHGIPEPFREVLLLHSCERMSADEIAEALGISEKTVWTRLHRARKAAQAAGGAPAARGKDEP